MRDFLARYIACDTSYPVYDYERACALLVAYATEHGLSARCLTLQSGYPAIVIELSGSDGALPALILNHHMDVVPAERYEGWHDDPFTLHCHDGMLIGRGVQDMKGVGVAQIAALAEFKKKHGMPQRTIYCIAVPHEESGGFAGTECFINDPFFKTVSVGYVLDEGMPSGDVRKVLIKISEKAPLQMEITVRGQAAHGSSLGNHYAIDRLLAFIHETKKQVNFLNQRGNNCLEPGLLFSYNCTSLYAGSAHALNCIPAVARATVDIRVPPEEPFDAVLAIFDNVSALYDCDYTIVARGIPSLPCAALTTELYVTVHAALTSLGYESEPLLFCGSTDARFYSQQGICVLGITPFACAPALHTINESILITDLERARDIYLTFLTLFCKEKNQ